MQKKSLFVKVLLCLIILTTLIACITACGEKESYKVEFMVDGNVHGTVLVSGNETVMLPKDPEKAGYTFVGWFLDNDTFEKPFKATQFVTTAISADTKVYAKFIKDNTGEHTCSYASEWSKNETSHWRLCECGEKGYLGDHVFDEGTVRVNPTCTDEGEKIYFCETCGYTKTEKISTIPHAYYDAWNSNSTNHWKLCKCGDKGYNTPHDFDKGEIIIEATCTREGQIKYVCDTCGYEKTEIIKKEDHKYSTEYTMNAEYHFYECSCGAKQGEEKHTPSAPATIDKDQVCTKCGYVLAKYAGITFNTLSQSGTNLSGKVRNSVTSFDFNSEITVHGNATFVVSRDKYGETPISTKVVTLNAGNNVFYVQEIIGGEVEETYTVTLRRRPTYTVTFVTLGSNVPAQTVEEDFLATKPTQNPVRVGYTFAGWDYDFNSAVTSAITVNAKWTPNENTAYKVEHWFENANDSGYTKDASKTETKYATTGTNVVAISKNFEHFHFNADKSEVIGTVAPDGSLVIILYYDREKINVVFNANGGTIVGENKEIVSRNIKYGGSITAPNAEKVGYEFLGWDTSLTNVTENLVVNAKWKIKQYSITLVLGNGQPNKLIKQDYNSTVTETLPENLERAGYTFDGWDKEMPSKIPAENVTITVKWKAIYEIKGSTITRLTEHGKTLIDIVVPEKIDGATITEIGDSSFTDSDSLTSITIPSSIESIGWDAFFECNSLKTVKLSEGLTSISHYAFSDCVSLESITIPDSVISLGDNVFYNCTSLESITIGNGVESIGENVFQNCDSLLYNMDGNLKYLGNESNKYLYLAGAISDRITSATINSKCKIIGLYAFSTCSNLTSITIPDNVKTIGEGAFQFCYGLKEVTISNNVTIIPDMAFRSCTSLENVIIGKNVQRIESFAFNDCQILKQITIPNNVTFIGYGVLGDCFSLNSITFDGTMEQWKAIEKEPEWKERVPATYVQCTDGRVDL